MKNLEKKIFKVLSEHPNGIKGSEIARIIGADKKEVNHFLTFDQDEYVRNDEYLWLAKGGKSSKIKTSSIPQTFSDAVLQKLNNREGAKKFTLKDFNAIADWSVCDTHNSDNTPVGTYKTKTGNRIDYDSATELKMLSYLDNSGVVEAMGGQNLCLPYSTAFTSEKYYYPDIIALTNDGYIAVIEVKPVTAMSYNIVLAKYDALADYCEENGYMYMMVDPDHDFMTFDELYDLKIDSDLFEIFEEFEKQRSKSKNPIRFDADDVNEWYEDIGEGYTKTEFNIMVHSCIIYFDWYNKKKNGFNCSSEPFKS